jgi:hypothetical protein
MKLIETGQWTWRKDELSYKEFTQLKREEKDEYLFLLKGLPEDERSSNDIAIINIYLKEKKQINNFFEL